uniref:Uncharacterized protein n=1 Tax=Romanomermis culicivorax TaxID=13658 RepID=A0A915J6S5_ROMCU
MTGELSLKSMTCRKSVAFEDKGGTPLSVAKTRRSPETTYRISPLFPPSLSDAINVKTGIILGKFSATDKIAFCCSKIGRLSLVSSTSTFT